MDYRDWRTYLGRVSNPYRNSLRNGGFPMNEFNAPLAILAGILAGVLVSLICGLITFPD